MPEFLNVEKAGEAFGSLAGDYFYLTVTVEVYVLPATTTETVFFPAVTVYLKA